MFLNVFVVKKSLNCTFNFGMCGWTQDENADFDWLENKGETPEKGTGPRHDHSPDGRK